MILFLLALPGLALLILVICSKLDLGHGNESISGFPPRAATAGIETDPKARASPQAPKPVSIGQIAQAEMP